MPHLLVCMVLTPVKMSVHPWFRWKVKTLTYSPSEQHACNAGVLVQCDKCTKWHLLFSKRKLSARERAQLEGIIAEGSYSCGATIADLILPDALKSVGIYGAITVVTQLRKSITLPTKMIWSAFTVAVRKTLRYLSSQILFICTVLTVCRPNVFTNTILCSVLHFMYVSVYFDLDILNCCAFWNIYCVLCYKGALKIPFLCLSN